MQEDCVSMINRVKVLASSMQDLAWGLAKARSTFGFKHGGAFEMYIAQVIVNFAWYILKVKCTVQTRRLMLQSLNALTPRAVYKINLIASASGNNIRKRLPFATKLCN